MDCCAEKVMNVIYVWIKYDTKKIEIVARKRSRERFVAKYVVELEYVRLNISQKNAWDATFFSNVNEWQNIRRGIKERF